MSQEQFLAACPVSRETIHNLSTYATMLEEWNNRFNLVASSTLSQIWTRHFLDSAQLYAYIPGNAEIVADMGAGAGFPGMVLAIMAKEQGRDLHFHEIESTGKKADFLQAVAEKLALNVTIRRDRVENIRDLKADIVTARALKALPELFKYANYLTKQGTICLFPKGKSLSEELTEARKYWTFESEIHPSRSDDTGQFLVVRNLKYQTRR